MAGLFGRNVLLVLGGFLMFNMVLISFLSFSPTFLQGEGMDATLAGFASTLPMLVAVASSPLFGVLADKTGRLKALMVASMLVMGPCAAVLLTTAGPALWAAALVMGVVGLGAPTMFLIVYPSVVANKDAMPIAMGFLVLTQSLGQFSARPSCPRCSAPDGPPPAPSRWCWVVTAPRPCCSVREALPLRGPATQPEDHPARSGRLASPGAASPLRGLPVRPRSVP